MAWHTNAFDLLDEEDSDDLLAVVDHVVAKKMEKQRLEEEERKRKEEERARQEEEKRKATEAETGGRGRGGRGRGRGGRGGDLAGGRSRGRGGYYNGGRGYGNGDHYYQVDNRGYNNGGGNGVERTEGAEIQNQEGGNWQYQNGAGYYDRRDGRGSLWRGQGRGYYQDGGYEAGEQYYDQGYGEVGNQYYEYGNQGAPIGDGYNGGRGIRGYRNDTQGFRGEEGQQGQGNGSYANQMWVPVSKNDDGNEKTVNGDNEHQLTDGKTAEVVEGTERKNMPGKNPVHDGAAQSHPVKGTKSATGKPESEVQEVDDSKKMTLVEYEKIVLEKRKAVETVKPEARKVDSKEFEGMLLVSKKKEDDAPHANAKSEDKPTRKGSSEKEEKVGKVLSIAKFFQLPTNNQYRRGGFRGGYRGVERENGRGRPNFGYRNESQGGEQRNRGFRGGYSNGYDQGARGNGGPRVGYPANRSQDLGESGNGGSVNGHSNGAPRQNQGELTNGDSGRPAGQDRVQQGNGRGRGGYPARPAGQEAQHLRIRQVLPPKLEDQRQFPTLG